MSPTNTPTTDTDNQKEGHPRLKELSSTIGVLVLAFLAAILIITFVFRTYEVDGPSMRNTLENSDTIIIWKIPRTWSKITRHAYIPERGNIIVFEEGGLSEFGQEDKKQLIKRVIALPGERIVLADGVYTVYNDESPKGFNPDQDGALKNAVMPTSGSVDLVLKKDQIFVSGDNRPDSLDSRTFGPISAKQVVGKLVLRVLPLSKSEVF